MITQEQILARLAELKRQREQVQANVLQLQANLNAYDGAIQDCEYWLDQLAGESPADNERQL